MVEAAFLALLLVAGKFTLEIPSLGSKLEIPSLGTKLEIPSLGSQLETLALVGEALGILKGRGVGTASSVLPPGKTGVTEVSAASAERLTLYQAGCKSPAPDHARSAMASRMSSVWPSICRAPLRTRARDERLPEPAAKPGARCKGQRCHTWPHEQIHLADVGEDLQLLHLAGLKANLKCKKHLAQSLTASQAGL